MIDFDFMLDFELEILQEITDLKRQEILDDFRLFCHYAELPINGKSWAYYFNEMEKEHLKREEKS
jgi:hypothetical protein